MKTNLKYNFIILILIIILLYLYFYLYFYLYSNNIEGFNTTRSETWSHDLTQRFIKYQLTVNKNENQYNLKVLQTQATPEEAEHLLKTGYWPWSNEIKYLYMEAVSRNPMIQIDIDAALDYAMKNYCENAAKQKLLWNTKEGEFLLYGAYPKKVKKGDFSWINTYNRNVSTLDGSYSLIKCDYINDQPIMKKLTYHSNNGYLAPSEVIIDNENIPNELPGFKFVTNSCNPCNVFKENPEYNCPFILNTEKEHDNSISAIWKLIWNIKE